MRKEFSAKTKATAFRRSGGFCEECKCKLQTGKIEYDHRIPCAMGGENDLANCVVLCKSCHKNKTKTDKGTIAKSERIFRRHVGATVRRRKIPGSRGTGLRRRMDGTVERRKE